MSAAGAPPPPPPPPPPPRQPKDFDSLPAELLLAIIGYLHTDDFVKFALAIYPLLQHHGLVPPLTTDIYHRITRQERPPSNGTVSEWRLPVELTEWIMDYLEPADRLAMLFSHRSLFWEYLPMLSDETRKTLWKARER